MCGLPSLFVAILACLVAFCVRFLASAFLHCILDQLYSPKRGLKLFRTESNLLHHVHKILVMRVQRFIRHVPKLFRIALSVYVPKSVYVRHRTMKSDRTLNYQNQAAATPLRSRKSRACGGAKD